MTASHSLAEFQAAAVDHIVTRLRDRRGSRRFLLADEVGLGKTIVARGVINELARRRRTPLKVVYLCSNAEIAEQNRRKLVEDGGTSVARATELALLRGESHVSVDMYAFTPGTSLAGETGMMWERRLMLFLLHQVSGVDVSTSRWKEFFRCGAGQLRWNTSVKWAALREEFRYKTQGAFQSALREALGNARFEGRAFVKSMVEEVDSFSSDNTEARRRRNRLVGQYRGLLQRVALRQLQPDLLVLDEVQRFKDVIDKAEDESQIGYELFRSGTPVLILSATPYRLLTLEREARATGSDHYDDFFRTLEFLYARDRKSPARVRRNLEGFGRRLRELPLDRSRDAKLLGLKRDIEADLRKVICRTERNWFFLDSRRGVAEQGVHERELPGRAEIKEFMDIHQGLSAHLDGVGLVTDFWKSAPSILTFMDGSYALTRKLREKKVRVPRALLERADHPDLSRRNLRVRRLVAHSLGGDGERPFLWTRPTYTYHEDNAYGPKPPRKMLVFSGWRFVPKAVAVLVSDAAAARLGKPKGDSRQPLRFSSKGSLHVFDTCMPSWALSEAVGHFSSYDGETVTPKAEQILQDARRRIEKRLREIGVTIAPTRADPLWQIVARMEQRSGAPHAIAEALNGWTDSDEVTDAGMDAQEALLAWLDDDETSLSIGQADLHRLALVAVASPAVCLLRAFRDTYGDDSVAEAMGPLLQLCLGEMRSYFNRPLVQRVIRRHVPRFRWRRRRGGAKRSFSEGLLAYSLDHHLQAVLDEHSYLLRNASASASVEEAVRHYRSIWSLGRGARRTNRASGRGEQVHIGADADTWPTHFALAFGEDTATDEAPSAEQDRRMRRSEVREAFNSPFWPFVLATTSVGQEGLDFHLHCRDVFHWNLPSNPVDLEQREGRINRRDCLAVRQSIAQDVLLSEVLRLGNGERKNLWAAVFDHLEKDASGGRSKHGLHPHWIYECRDRERTVPIERHVAFFEASRDSRQYTRLKNGLALYRLVFGQVNQEHLLSDLEKRLAAVPEVEREAVKRHLSGYMLNLSPIDSAVALRFAHQEAGRLLGVADGAGVRALHDEVERIVRNHAQELAPVLGVIRSLQEEMLHALETGALKTHRVRKVATALAYLRNPYDQYFDGQSVGGFDDDIPVLKRALAKR